MAEDRSDLLDRFRNMRADLLGVIDGLSPEQLSERTLDGWNVKDHLFHIAAWDTMRALEVRRISAGHESAFRLSHEQDERYNALLYEMHEGLTAQQALWELESSHERLLSALGAATERGLDGLLYGEAGLLSSHEAQHTGWIRRWRAERDY